MYIQILYEHVLLGPFTIFRTDNGLFDIPQNQPKGRMWDNYLVWFGIRSVAL